MGIESMRKFYFVFFICLSLLITQKSFPELADTVLVRVNGKVITLSELNNYYYALINGKSSQQYAKPTKEQALEVMINNEILFQLAKEKKINISQYDIDQEIKKIRSKSKAASHDDFLKALEQQGIKSLDLLRYEVKKMKSQQNLMGYIIQMGLVDSPAYKELKKIYEENKEDFKEKSKVKISHIFIKVSNDDSYADGEAKEKVAKKITNLLDKKVVTFASMAKKYSEDKQTASRGGVLGWYDKDTLESMSYELAFELEKGQHSDIIWTDKGIHIIKVLNKREGREIDFTEAKKYIQQNILNKKAVEYLNKMLKIKRKTSLVTYLDTKHL